MEQSSVVENVHKPTFLDTYSSRDEGEMSVSSSGLHGRERPVSLWGFWSSKTTVFEEIYFPLLYTPESDTKFGLFAVLKAQCLTKTRV